MFTKIVTPIVIALALTQTAQANLDLMRKEMDAFQKPMVESLKNTLEKDPEFSKVFKMYQQEMKPVLEIKDPKVRHVKAESVGQKYKATFDRAMKKAKIDPEQSKKKAAQLSVKYDTKKINYTLRPGEYLTYVQWQETQNQNNEPPVETEQEFTPPFEFEHSSNVGLGDTDIDLEEGTFFSSASGYFAAHENVKAGFGMFLRLNWDAGRVRVSTRLAEITYWVSAVSVGGGAGAKASSIIDLVTEDGQECKKAVVHAEAIAPFMWTAYIDGEDTTVFACEMDAPPRNQDLAIRFQGAAEITVAVNASASAFTSGKAQPIRARLLE